MKLKGQVAMVTGGARGIGKAIALAFLREGAKVAIIDSDKERLEILKKEFEKENKEVIVIPCDITKGSEVNAMVDQVHKSLGRIDILVNNAGIIRRGTIDTVTEEDWDRVIEVNLKGTFNCCKAVVETMKSQKYGNRQYLFHRRQDGRYYLCPRIWTFKGWDGRPDENTGKAVGPIRN